MFDIGFWELCMVGLVSLLVIGPEKLPKVARVVGFWLGKARHVVAVTKEEIKDELKADELKQLIKEQQAQLDAVTENFNLNERAEKFLDNKPDTIDK